MALAKGGLDVPLKIFAMLDALLTEKIKPPAVVPVRADCNNRAVWCKWKVRYVLRLALGCQRATSQIVEYSWSIDLWCGGTQGNGDL